MMQKIKIKMLQKTIKGVDSSMRHKMKKEAVDTIAMRIANDASGKIIADLLVLAKATFNEKSKQIGFDFSSEEYLSILNRIEWLYGYEADEIPELMRSLKLKCEEIAFYKGSSYVKILTSIAVVGVLFSYNRVLLPQDEVEGVENWEVVFEESDNLKVSTCYEIFKRHCPFEITVKDFIDARRYIKMWDSEFNW